MYCLGERLPVAASTDPIRSRDVDILSSPRAIIQKSCNGPPEGRGPGRRLPRFPLQLAVASSRPALYPEGRLSPRSGLRVLQGEIGSLWLSP